jgi:hypothetical protein
MAHEMRKLKVITKVIEETYVYHDEDDEDNSPDHQVDGGQVD